MIGTLLGGLSPATFLARHWQKAPLLVRAAVPGFGGALDRQALFRLAAREDVESRLVVRQGRRRVLERGPFPMRRLKSLPPRDWTLLVQGVNLLVAEADALLHHFRFIPYARLDDVMVSVAAPGGGVGPHFDSYDVFLLQGCGRRRWRISAQRDLDRVPGIELKLLRRFRAEREWVLEPGDMLYLPPDIAHDGIALDDCTTWSIGFRAPQAQELAIALLRFVEDATSLEGRYSDPDLAPTREPARIDRRLAARMTKLARPPRFDRALLARFLGCWLTEPKPEVSFAHPARPLSRARFAAAIRRGVVLDPRTRLLYDAAGVYVNGEHRPWPQAGAKLLRRLANDRALAGDSGTARSSGRTSTARPAATASPLPDPLLDLLHEWYRHGYLAIDR